LVPVLFTFYIQGVLKLNKNNSNAKRLSYKFHFYYYGWWCLVYLLGIVLSVHTCWYHNMVTLPSRFVSTDFGRWSYFCSLSIFIPTPLHILKCSSAHILACLFMYCSFSNIGHAKMMCCTVSSNCLQSRNFLSVSVRNIVVCYFVCNAWSWAAIISSSTSPFRSPLESHTNVSTLPLSCPSILLIYFPCINLLSHSFFKDSPNFDFIWNKVNCQLDATG